MTWLRASSANRHTSNQYAEENNFASLSYLSHAGTEFRRGLPFLQ
jgi:hypothetical protein